MRKSSLDLKPNYQTQEGRQPSDQCDDFAHITRSKCVRMFKSSPHWFAHSPLLSVLHESTLARKNSNTQTIRGGPLAREAITSSPPPKTTTTAGQTHEQTTRQPWPSTSKTVIVALGKVKLCLTCVVAMRFLIVCMAMCSLNNPC